MLILNRCGVLEYPVLYLSGYFNNCRDEYIASLNGIKERDDFGTWIELFLNALIEQSRQSIELIDSLFAYRKQLHESETDPNTLRLIDSLFVNPFVRKADVVEICGVHLSTAGKIVNSLVERSVLTEISGRKRNQMFVCDTIMRMLNSY